MPWIPVLKPGDPRERLFFRYDPRREIVEIQSQGHKYYFDLLALKEQWEQAQRREMGDMGAIHDDTGCGSIGA